METQIKKRRNLFLDIVQEKCPHCREGHVYEQGRGFFRAPVMQERCEVCKYSYLREPGYFLGAMYISYGIAVLLGLLTFVVLYLAFPSLPTIWIPLIIIGVITLISRKNFKLSRVIYMHLFPW